MTYCLAMRLAEGLVFLGDTRTNAGVDNMGTYRKLHVIQPARDRVFVIESAGNLATTQEVLDRIERDLAAATGSRAWPPWTTSSKRPSTWVGWAVRSPTPTGRVWPRAAPTPRRPSSSGARCRTAPDILLVYPEGNYIRASEEQPFLQIGESKYGKYMLELAVQSQSIWTPSRPADRPRVDDEHGPGQPVGRAAVRRGDLPERFAPGQGVPVRERLPAADPIAGGLGTPSAHRHRRAGVLLPRRPRERAHLLPDHS